MLSPEKAGRLMHESLSYQYGRTLELRQCFPFEYSKMPAVILKPTMVKEELYICEDFSKDKVITVSSYEEIGNYIKEGKASYYIQTESTDEVLKFCHIDTYGLLP